MRPKVLKWEVIILCVILFFPGISLNAQEVRQDDIYEIRQSSFSRYGFDTLSVHTPHRFIHRLGVEVRNMCFLPIPSCREKTNAGNPFRPLLPLI